MKKNNTVKYVGLAIAAYLLYQWYKKKPMAPVAPGAPTNVDQLTNTIMQSADSTQPAMSIAPSGAIVSELMTTTAAPKEIPSTYQTFYGSSLNGSKVGKVPMTC